MPSLMEIRLGTVFMISILLQQWQKTTFMAPNFTRKRVELWAHNYYKIFCHHEQACAMAADSYFRLTNKPAIVQVTTGPGSINALNGVYGAFAVISHHQSTKLEAGSRKIFRFIVPKTHLRIIVF